MGIKHTINKGRNNSPRHKFRDIFNLPGIYQVLDEYGDPRNIYLVIISPTHRAGLYVTGNYVSCLQWEDWKHSNIELVKATDSITLSND